MRRLTAISLMAASAFGACAATLAERLVLTDTVFTRPASEVLANPAMAPLRRPVSLSHAAVGYDRAMLDKATDDASGRGTAAARFDADAYIKQGRATITGNAAYSNGRRYGVQYCMVSDPAMVYPYFTAVDALGDFRNEVYTFGGSYSSDFRGGRWLYGVSLDYRAVQEYRDTDPRPKNTVGQLSFAVGFGGRFGRNIVAVGLKAFKYRQSNSIMFVSELGELPVYHLTGLTSHYARFAGTGKSADYSGWSRGASVDLYPTADGAFASASFDRFTFTKTLKDMNNLPLDDVTDDRYTVSAGWKAASWSASAYFAFDKRTGTENIFGDPAGNVYPELFSLSTYGCRRTLAGTRGAWRLLTEGMRVDVYAASTYSFTEEVYKGVVPRLRQTAERCIIDIDAQICKTLSSKISINASIGGQAVPRHYYSAGAQAGADYMLGGNKALGVTVGYSYRNAGAHNTGYALTTALAFKF